MLVGYTRTSMLEQDAGLEAQRRELASLGYERFFAEQTSSVGPRKALDEALGVRNPRLYGFRHAEVREVKSRAFQLPVCGSTPERENLPA